uniref:Uncharacterized protein n=1 Tax=Opuntia streptacantha TaxID=393608 RepID=A0A7C9B148_OPUST
MAGRDLRSLAPHCWRELDGDCSNQMHRMVRHLVRLGTSFDKMRKLHFQDFLESSLLRSHRCTPIFCQNEGVDLGHETPALEDEGFAVRSGQAVYWMWEGASLHCLNWQGSCF